MSILVTVGSTHFEELIQAIDSEEFALVAVERGYHTIQIQYGPKAEYIPNVLTKLVEQTKEMKGGKGLVLGEMEIKCFPLTHSFHDILKASDLVISHAGTGTIMEGLELEKMMIVVVNESLADNHQKEIAEAMYTQGHVLLSKANMLIHTMKTADFSSLIPLPKANTHAFEKLVDEEMGFKTTL